MLNGFNVIKHPVQNKNETESIINLFQTVFDKIWRNKMNICFKTIQQNKVQDEQIEV